MQRESDPQPGREGEPRGAHGEQTILPWLEAYLLRRFRFYEDEHEGPGHHEKPCSLGVDANCESVTVR